MAVESVDEKDNGTSNGSINFISVSGGASYGTCDKSNDNISVQAPKLYKIRFFMLLLFSLCTLLNGFQWIQFSIITSIVKCYYGVSVASINLTAVLYNIMYFPFIIPVAWMMSTKGLKLTLITAAAGNCIGACMQCFSLARDRFYVVLLTQVLASISQVFSASPPAYVAAVWFGSNEVSVACAIGVISNQLGIALGCIVPPILVPNTCDDVPSVTSGLRNLAMGQAVINTALLLGMALFFKDKPPTPPSFAELNKPTVPESASRSLWKMFKNVHFSLLLLTYGLQNSVCSALVTMLNQMVVRTFPGKEVEAGWIGVEAIFAGVIGCFVFGYILDRTHRFRELSFTVCLLSLLVMVVYTVIYTIKILWMHFIMFGIMGFMMSSYIPVAYEFAAEIAYPASEGSSTTLMVASSSLFTIPITMLASWLEQTYGDLSSNLFFCSCLAVACVISAFIKCEKKRCMQNHLTQK